MDNFRCAHNDHVCFEVLLPCLLIPEIWAHGTIKMANFLTQVVPENSCLLEHQSYTVDLISVNINISQGPIRFSLGKWPHDEACQATVRSAPVATYAWAKAPRWGSFRSLVVLLESLPKCREVKGPHRYQGQQWCCESLLAQTTRSGKHEGPGYRTQSLSLPPS